MPKRIRDLATGNATQGHFVPVDPTAGSTYKAALGQASGVALLDGAGIPLDSAGRRVVSSGSNSNGVFVRFSDGTQICYLRRGIEPYSGETYYIRDWFFVWTYPAAFISTPAINASFEVIHWQRPWNDGANPDYGGGHIAETHPNNTVATSPTAVQFRYFYRQWGGLVRINATAIGRWY